MNKKLYQYIKQAPLEREEKHRFIGALSLLSRQEQETFLSLFRADPKAVMVMFQNFESKRAAVATGKKDALLKAIEDEKVVLQDIVEQS
jgi:hypothetical protein